MFNICLCGIENILFRAIFSKSPLGVMCKMCSTPKTSLLVVGDVGDIFIFRYENRADLFVSAPSIPYLPNRSQTISVVTDFRVHRHTFGVKDRN